MRRRVPEPSRYSGEVPPELRLGACIEIWAEDGLGHISASRRFRRARQAWSDEHGLSDAEYCRLFPGGSPWSFRFLIAEGRRGEAERRLAEAGVTEADIPQLREAAAAYPRPD